MEEPVAVRAEFGNQGMAPKSFTHAGRTHGVDRVLYRWKKREGTEQIFYFSVLSGYEQFTLSFATRTLKWRLEHAPSFQPEWEYKEKPGQDGYF